MSAVTALAKAVVTTEDLALLLTFVDSQKLSQEPKERNLTVQRYVLATLAGLASFGTLHAQALVRRTTTSKEALAYTCAWSIVIDSLIAFVRAEKHQRKIGELGAVKLLLPFLELVESSVSLDGEVLSSVLETLDHLLTLSTLAPAALAVTAPQQ
jgi:hypothetical protein